MSRQPPVLMVALSPRRATYELIKSSGKASVNVLGANMLKVLHYLGTVSLARNPNKMREAGVRVSFVGDFVRIEGALAVLYCRLRDHLNMGDHDAVFLEVVGADVLEGFGPKAKVGEYRFILHIGGGEYTTNAGSVITP